jgi:hypothetical protein
MEKPRREMGRPAGRDYPIIKQMRLGSDDARKLGVLAEKWRCSEAAAVRRAIAIAAEQEGVE